MTIGALLHEEAVQFAYEIIIARVRELASCVLQCSSGRAQPEEIIRELGKKIRSLAREMPTLMMQHGITPVISYLLAKATSNIYNNVVRFMRQRTFPSEAFDIDRVAHALYLYLLIAWIARKIPEFRDVIEGSPENASEKVIDLIGRLWRNVGAMMRVQRSLNLVMYYAKELAEAYYEAER